MNILLKVDKREKSKRKEKESKVVIMYLEKYAQDLLEKKNIKVKIVREQLDVGDFQICDPVSEYPYVIFERKKWNDFASSIKPATRYKDEKHNMIRESEIKGNKILFLFEGQRLSKNGKMIGKKHPNRLIGVVRRLSLGGIPSLYSRNLEHSMEILIDCAKDVASKLKRKCKIYTSVDQVIIDKLNKLKLTPGLSDEIKSQLENITANTQIDIPETYDKDMFKEIYLSEDYKLKRKVLEIWTSLDGIQPKLASLIIEKISIYDFICEPTKLYELDIVYISGRKISRKQIDKIIENLKDKNKQIFLLSKVPQMSKNRAEAILKEYDIEDILNEDIANVLCGKKRIGNAQCETMKTHLTWTYEKECQ